MSEPRYFTQEELQESYGDNRLQILAESERLFSSYPRDPYEPWKRILSNANDAQEILTAFFWSVRQYLERDSKLAYLAAWQEQPFVLVGRVVTDNDLIVGMALGPEYANQRDLEFKHAALQDFGGFASDEDTPDWKRVDYEPVVYLPGEFRGQLHIFKLRLALYHASLPDNRFSQISDQDIPGFLADAVEYGLSHMGTYYSRY